MSRSTTNDKSIVTADSAINRSSSNHWIPVGLLDTQNTPRPVNRPVPRWYAPLSIGRTNRRTYLAIFAIRACRDRGNVDPVSAARLLL